MRDKILNCQNFAFHNVTLWFSHRALSTSISSPRELTLYQWRGNVFWTGGAQNSKIVSTSGGRSPPDPPFFERTFL